MTALPWLALPLLAPLFGLLVWLGLILRPTARRRMLGWCGLGLLLAIVGCAWGASQPEQHGHALWPQIAAATAAFLAYVLTWLLGLWWTRSRTGTSAQA